MQRDKVKKRDSLYIYIYKGTGCTSKRDRVLEKRVRNPSETARQFPPHAKNPFCIKISCPRIADRPADLFSDPPNSTIGSSARLPPPPPLCRT